MALTLKKKSLRMKTIDYEVLPEPNTFWVDKDLLVQHVGKPGVKEAVKERQKQVLAEL